MLEIKCKEFWPVLERQYGEISVKKKAYEFLCDELNTHPEYQVVNITAANHVNSEFLNYPVFYLFYKEDK